METFQIRLKQIGCRCWDSEVGFGVSGSRFGAVTSGHDDDDEGTSDVDDNSNDAQNYNSAKDHDEHGQRHHHDLEHSLIA